MPLESKCWFDEDDDTAHIEIWCPRPEMGLLVCEEDVMRQATLSVTVLNRLEINEERRKQIEKIIESATSKSTTYHLDGKVILERTPRDIAREIFSVMVTSGMVRADVNESDIPF